MFLKINEQSTVLAFFHWPVNDLNGCGSVSSPFPYTIPFSFHYVYYVQCTVYTLLFDADSFLFCSVLFGSISQTMQIVLNEIRILFDIIILFFHFSTIILFTFWFGKIIISKLFGVLFWNCLVWQLTEFVRTLIFTAKKGEWN